MSPDLARRAVAAAGWTPQCSTVGSPCTRSLGTGALWRPYGEVGALEWLPDLDDAATLGALLGAVRSAWGTTSHLVRMLMWVPNDDGTDTVQRCWWALAVGLASVPFTVRVEDEYGVGTRFLSGPTEAEALVVALETARGAA